MLDTSTERINLRKEACVLSTHNYSVILTIKIVIQIEQGAFLRFI